MCVYDELFVSTESMDQPDANSKDYKDLWRMHFKYHTDGITVLNTIIRTR